MRTQNAPAFHSCRRPARQFRHYVGLELRATVWIGAKIGEIGAKVIQVHLRLRPPPPVTAGSDTAKLTGVTSFKEDTMDDQVPNEVKRQLITNEVQMWRNTAYQLVLRHKVNKRIGADPSVLKQIEDEMVKCEGALEVLQEELDELKKEPE
jgi:hypothetical protein